MTQTEEEEEAFRSGADNFQVNFVFFMRDFVDATHHCTVSDNARVKCVMYACVRDWRERSILTKP